MRIVTDPNFWTVVAICGAVIVAAFLIASAVRKQAAATSRLASAAEARNKIDARARGAEIERVTDRILQDADRATAHRVEELRRDMNDAFNQLSGQAMPHPDDTATVRYDDLRRATGPSRLEASHTGVIARGKVIGIGYVGEKADPVKMPVPFRDEIGSDDPREIASDVEMSRRLAVFFDRQIEANLPPDYQGPVPRFWEPWPHDPRISGYQAIMDWYYATFGFQFIPDLEMQIPWLLGDLGYIQWKEHQLPPADYPQP